MNPFLKRDPLPPGTCGERHFASAVAAKESAINRGVASYAVLRAGQEYAWISPIEAFTARAAPALLAGIVLVDWSRK